MQVIIDQHADFVDLGALLLGRLSEIGVTDPGYFGTTPEALRPFSRMSKETALQLARDFYVNKYAPYEYDFSVTSKHALSRIYEHYISLLRETDSPQSLLFGGMPTEISNRAVGGIYTPQYIARFFSRFIRDNLTPRQFRTIKTLDPACGSGIFLRSLLELQCDPLLDVVSSDVEEAFSNVLGVDVDPSACHATRLSLALLSLSLTGQFPQAMKILNEEAIDFFSGSLDFRQQFDAVIANPPFIKWDRLTEPMRESVASFLGDAVAGKPDAFLALLALGLDLVKPGGFLLYVLPHSFLLARNAQGIRKKIRETCSIRMVVDLSQIPVFEGVGTYVVLLVLEKKHGRRGFENPAVVVRCRDAVGEALQDALDGRLGVRTGYSVYHLAQSAFDGHSWELLSPKQFALRKRLEALPRLDEVVDIHEGMVTGADKIFVRPDSAVAPREQKVFPRLLKDREMRRFSMPKATRDRVFYPFVDGVKLRVDEIERDYPETWRYLKKHEEMLRGRSSVAKGTVEWWAPERPRRPEKMFGPKIVAPHLMLTPKFSIDYAGTFAVSRSPIMVLKASTDSQEMLYLICAFLNSPIVHWQLALSAHKYSRGYLMLEPRTLRAIRIPNLGRLRQRQVAGIANAVERGVLGRAEFDERIVNELVIEAYGLGAQEVADVGLV